MQDRLGNLHDALGRFARSGRQVVRTVEPGDRPGNRTFGTHRGRAAFEPPSPSAGRRANKELVPSKVRELNAVYSRRARGDRLTGQEQSKIEWSSPRRRAEQRAKTGDVIQPRGEAVRGIRSYARSTDNYRPRRTGIKKTFTGQPKLERGNYRDLPIPTPGRPGSFDMKLESRVRRAFDWPAKGPARAKMAPQTAAKPKVDPSRFTLMPDSRLRELAVGMGITVPKRAGRNQIIKLITGAN